MNNEKYDPTIRYVEVHNLDSETLRDFVTKIRSERFVAAAARGTKKGKKARDSNSGQLKTDDISNMPEEVSADTHKAHETGEGGDIL